MSSPISESEAASSQSEAASSQSEAASSRANPAEHSGIRDPSHLSGAPVGIAATHFPVVTLHRPSPGALVVGATWQARVFFAVALSIFLLLLPAVIVQRGLTLAFCLVGYSGVVFAVIVTSKVCRFRIHFDAVSRSILTAGLPKRRRFSGELLSQSLAFSEVEAVEYLSCIGETSDGSFQSAQITLRCWDGSRLWVMNQKARNGRVHAHAQTIAALLQLPLEELESSSVP